MNKHCKSNTKSESRSCDTADSLNTAEAVDSGSFSQSDLPNVNVQESDELIQTPININAFTVRQDIDKLLQHLLEGEQDCEESFNSNLQHEVFSKSHPNHEYSDSKCASNCYHECASADSKREVAYCVQVTSSSEEYLFKASNHGPVQETESFNGQTAKLSKCYQETNQGISEGVCYLYQSQNSSDTEYEQKTNYSFDQLQNNTATNDFDVCRVVTESVKQTSKEISVSVSKEKSFKSILKHFFRETEASSKYSVDKVNVDKISELDKDESLKELPWKLVSELVPDFIDICVEYIVFPVSGEIVTTQQQERNISSNMSSLEPLQTIINQIANGETVPPQISMRYEMLRFCTLRSFPKEDKPFITRIAEAGFYYANSGDEVICYCCAKRKRSWRENDNPMDVHRQMNPTCSFLTRNAEVNVPIKNNTESSTEESNSNTGNSTSRRHFESSPRSSSQNRIESTTVNNTSVPQSSPLSGANRVLTVAVDASAPRSVPATGPQSIVTGIPAALAATSVSSLRRGNQSNSILSVDVLQSRSENQPTTLHSGGGNASTSTRPKYPKYENIAARLASFTDCRDLVITSDKLADAGFFYASFGDCVRCFQCGLGLRHWSAEDDPWIEHSRWSKDCTYVRQIKGSEFVRIVQMAVEYNQHNSENEETSSQEHQGAVGGQTGEQSSEQTDKLMHTDATQSVLEMGYDPDIIRRAIRMINPTADGEKLNAVKLMEKVFEIEESESQGSAVASEPETVPNEHQVVVKTSKIESKTSTSETSEELNANLGHSNNTGAVGSDTPGDSRAMNTKEKAKTTTDTSDKGTAEKSQHSGDAEATIRSMATQSSKLNGLNNLPTGSCSPSIRSDSITSRKTHLLEQRRLKEENKKLKQQSICTKCKKNDVSIVFLPCGHLVTCDVCAPTVRYCTVDTCGKYIKGTVRTYLA